MDRQKVEKQEFRAMFDRLDHEVDLLYEAITGKEEQLDDDYAEQVARAQLESIGEIVEVMSENLGDGEKISVTTPSELEDEME